MNLPFTLPDWMPGWAFMLLALPVLLWFLAFLLVPFSVFGVKARLEALEGQIDALQEDLRVMGMRMSGALPPAARQMEPAYQDEVPHFGMLKKSRASFPPPEEEETPAPRRAPIPQPISPLAPTRERLTPTPPPLPPRVRRTEPRLD
jgi:hypothetical protein